MRLTKCYVEEQLKELNQQMRFYNTSPLLLLLRARHTFLKSVWASGKYDAEENIKQWRTLSSFDKYHMHYVTRQFNEKSLTVYRTFIERHREKMLSVYYAAFTEGMSFKYSRKQPGNGLASMLITPKVIYLITPLIIARPTLRSVVKIIVPILKQDENIIVKFSEPRGLKVIYSTSVGGLGADALSLLYGDDIEIITDKSTFKRYFIMPIFSGVALDGFYTHYVAPLLNGAVEMQCSLLQLLTIMRAIAQDLQRIHRANWVHFDIKPNNIFLEHCASDKYRARIIDADDMRKQGTLLSGQLGTLTFSAVEVLNNREITANFSADIYSLGRTFICFLTAGCKSWKAQLAESGDETHYSWEEEVTELIYTEENYTYLVLETWCNTYLALPGMGGHRASLEKFKTLVGRMLAENPAERCPIAYVVDELVAIIRNFTSANVDEQINQLLPSAIRAEDLGLIKPLLVGNNIASDWVFVNDSAS